MTSQQEVRFEELQKLRKALGNGVLDYIRSKNISYHFAIMVLKDVIGYLESDMRDKMVT